jgi:hypothetical protein
LQQKVKEADMKGGHLGQRKLSREGAQQTNSLNALSCQGLFHHQFDFESLINKHFGICSSAYSGEGWFFEGSFPPKLSVLVSHRFLEGAASVHMIIVDSTSSTFSQDVSSPYSEVRRESLLALH